SEEEPRLRELFADSSDIASWLRDWRHLLAHDPEPLEEKVAAMRAANPAVIPRNHRVQTALDAAESGDYGPFRALLEVVQRPFDVQLESSEYAQPPQPGEGILQTFCGT
ncbi:MAG: hypothetical protein ACRETZ_16310, partial [Steroidobacteraceae bacterium]